MYKSRPEERFIDSMKLLIWNGEVIPLHLGGDAHDNNGGTYASDAACDGCLRYFEPQEITAT